MKNNISSLLNKINRADSINSELILNDLDMTKSAKKRLKTLWDYIHFSCDKSINISEYLKDCQGYQIREIPIIIKSSDSIYTYLTDKKLTVSLDSHGSITGVRPSLLSHENTLNILSDSTEIDDISQRRVLLKFMEDYESFFLCRDYESICEIYNLGIENSNSNKQELKKCLNYLINRKSFRTIIDSVSLNRHGLHRNIYGLTFHQLFVTDSYKEGGWLFFLWDFEDSEKPTIHISRWQSDTDASINGIYTLEDFYIP
ncbi:MAG: hypothetical protein K2H47_12070 [Muribaculaceae bacterium]|nr:hypothetical protein [Muribaculaceae bacterium]